MALSEDQKAILRLLAQRGAGGYDDLAALLGTSVGEVYAKAKGAAAQLEAEGIPAPVVPEPLGAGSEPETAPPAPTPQKAEKSAAAPPPEVRKPRPAVRRPAFGGFRPQGWDRRWLIGGLAAVVAVVVVILLVSGGGGSNSSGTTASTTASAETCDVASNAPKPTGKTIAALAAATVKSGKGQEATRAVLNPVDGSEAGGLAVFGRVKKSLALQVAAEGLPSSSNCGYTIWIAASPQKMLPLASTEVGKDGKINAQVEVPVEILAYLANETFGQIAVTRTDESQLKASLAEATKERKAPVYTGTEVLRGTVAGPIVGAQKRVEAKESEAGK